MPGLVFYPNSLVRSCMITQTIALLYPSLTSEMTEPYMEFFSGALQATSLRKYSLLLCTVPERDHEVPYLLRQGMTDGLVLMEVRMDDPRIQVLRQQHAPFTMIGHSTENEGISFVDLDFEYAVKTCVDYLADLGHRHLAFISHSSKLLDLRMGYMVRSEQGFHKAVEQRGLEGITHFCETSAQAGYEAMQALLDLDRMPSALVVLNAWAAEGILQAIHDRGLRTPEDISLVGIFSPRVATTMVPQLTAIDFPYKDMGYMSTDLLLRQLAGEKFLIQKLLQPPLTIRGSSGPYQETNISGYIR